jgi:hypothetical protein
MSNYKPKFKQKELHAITRKFLSSDWEKWDSDPVEYEWVTNPKIGTGYVKVYFSLYDPENYPLIDKDATYFRCLPIEVFEIGYKAWCEKYVHK